MELQDANAVSIEINRTLKSQSYLVQQTLSLKPDADAPTPPSMEVFSMDAIVASLIKTCHTLFEDLTQTATNVSATLPHVDVVLPQERSKISPRDNAHHLRSDQSVANACPSPLTGPTLTQPECSTAASAQPSSPSSSSVIRSTLTSLPLHASADSPTLLVESPKTAHAVELSAQPPHLSLHAEHLPLSHSLTVHAVKLLIAQVRFATVSDLLTMLIHSSTTST